MKSRATTLALLLLCAGTAEAALIRVGPGGTHATVQAGLAAALGTPGTHEVRLAGGRTFYEHVEVLTAVATEVTVSGGWNAAFTARTGAPTVLDGDGTGRALRLGITSTRLSLTHLTVRGGYLEAGPHAIGGTFGAGIRAHVGGNAHLLLGSLQVLGNRIHAAIPALSSPAGAGAAFDVFGSGRLALGTSTFDGNLISRAPGSPVTGQGGGAWIIVREKGLAEVAKNTFKENRVEGTTFVGAGGLHVIVTAVSTPTIVDDNRFEANTVAGAAADDPAGSGLAIQADVAVARVVATARRNRLTGNGGAVQMRLDARGRSGVLASDSWVHAGPDGGAAASAIAPAAVALNNLTVVGNGATGIATTGVSYVYNSVAFANAIDTALAPGVPEGFNLVGVDPMFEPESAYRIQAGSPARDAGTNTPPGGLGPQDLERRARVVGPRVDIGADEFEP